MLSLILILIVSCSHKNPPKTPIEEQLQLGQCACPNINFKSPVLIGYSLFKDIAKSLSWCIDNKFLDSAPDIEGKYVTDLSGCICNGISKEDLQSLFLIELDTLRKISEAITTCQENIKIEEHDKEVRKHTASISN